MTIQENWATINVQYLYDTIIKDIISTTSILSHTTPEATGVKRYILKFKVIPKGLTELKRNQIQNHLSCQLSYNIRYTIAIFFIIKMPLLSNPPFLGMPSYKLNIWTTFCILRAYHHNLDCGESRVHLRKTFWISNKLDHFQ